MSRRAALEHQSVSFFLADKTIEQPVPMNVAAFSSAKKEPDSAEPMHTRAHLVHFTRRRFNGADRSQTSRVKKRRRGEQHCVENLRRAGNGCEPFQPANCEREDHESPFFSIGARSATDGPFKTLPYASKREPWQGQSQVVSVRFQCTMHLRCGQMAVISWIFPGLIAVDRDFLEPAADHSPLPRFQISRPNPRRRP